MFSRHAVKSVTNCVLKDLLKSIDIACKHTNFRRFHRRIGLVGVPFGKGQPKIGVAQAPRVLREAGLITNLNQLGYEVHDYGDLNFTEYEDDPKTANVENPRTVGAAANTIAQAVCKVILNNEICLALGGDHSMTVGTINGHAEAEPGIVVVWIDAHADINTPLSSTSGNFHGMPLSFVVKECQRYLPKVPGFDWLKPRIWARDIAYIGLRDVDPGERWLIEQLGITFYSIHDVDRYGLNEVLQRALGEVDPTCKRPIHLSYDIDALDPVLAPSTGTPVLGGLTIREGLFIAEEVAATGRLSAMDLVEVNPCLGNPDHQARTISTALQLVSHSFGKRRQGMYPPGYSLPVPDIDAQPKGVIHKAQNSVCNETETGDNIAVPIKNKVSS